MTTQFEKDLEKTINYNGFDVPLGVWNLILTQRDLSLFCGGLKPHGKWRLKDVKAYFGIRGNKETLLKKIETMVKEYVPE